MRAMATHAPETQTWHMQCVATARSVPLVRTQVRRALDEWGYVQSDIDNAVMVASELTTNAVVHGYRPTHPIEVGLVAAENTCLIQVSDSSPSPPKTLAAAPDDESGRGLLLVTALALQVGCRPRQPMGKTVWARLLMAPRGRTGPS